MVWVQESLVPWLHARCWLHHPGLAGGPHSCVGSLVLPLHAAEPWRHSHRFAPLGHNHGSKPSEVAFGGGSEWFRTMISAFEGGSAWFRTMISASRRAEIMIPDHDFRPPRALPDGRVHLGPPCRALPDGRVHLGPPCKALPNGRVHSHSPLRGTGGWPRPSQTAPAKHSSGARDGLDASCPALLGLLRPGPESNACDGERSPRQAPSAPTHPVPLQHPDRRCSPSSCRAR
jgi:hypothetical protein